MITDNARHENVPKAQLYKMPESKSRTKISDKNWHSVKFIISRIKNDKKML